LQIQLFIGGEITPESRATPVRIVAFAFAVAVFLFAVVRTAMLPLLS